ncbi:MAG: hypothetical protein QG597_4936, partial [Actinomycetota bacterium]|nr:hypothetical protein [Actinomycetota bacterium]
IEQRTGFRLTTPVRAVVETAAAGADQNVDDAAVAEIQERGQATRRHLLVAAGRLGPRAELGIERALRALA